MSCGVGRQLRPPALEYRLVGKGWLLMFYGCPVTLLFGSQTRFENEGRHSKIQFAWFSYCKTFYLRNFFWKHIDICKYRLSAITAKIGIGQNVHIGASLVWIPARVLALKAMFVRLYLSRPPHSQLTLSLFNPTCLLLSPITFRGVTDCWTTQPQAERLTCPAPFHFSKLLVHPRAYSQRQCCHSLSLLHIVSHSACQETWAWHFGSCGYICT